MVETFVSRRWSFRMLFVATAAALLFVSVLPVNLGRGTVPAPDLLVLLTIAWLLRRPDFVPAPLIAAVFLCADILLMRPLGLWSALVVLGTEYLRGRHRVGGDMPFFAEWMQVAGVLFALTALEWLIFTIFMIPQASVGALGLQCVITTALYPAVVFATQSLFRVRPPRAAERDAVRRGA
ncbi:rod shape-determining protein MreD [Palleronia aestuarii]|uniref:Rod shape-determining protein MreD n=1 Tax=Palleronia aestuarii TaxID=568105 RepID=A0A2W7NP82_9RHOB|nr:rod shape-determining protein MreD [Palleronia aestuarii]PZX18424.1 rod shape-determining protein MreD [Palleronia aestuarii]